MTQLKSLRITLASLALAYLSIAAGSTPTPEPVITPTATEQIAIAPGEGTELILIGAFCLLLVILAGVAWNARLHKPGKQG